MPIDQNVDANLLLFDAMRLLMPPGTGDLFDLTRRILFQGASDGRNDFVAQLIETIPNPIFYKNRTGHFLGCNSAFEEFIGLSRDRLIGRTVFEIAPRAFAERYYQADQELFDHPGKQIYEASVKAADGSRREVIFYKATFADSAGEVAGLVGLMLDITDRKRAEEALRASETRHLSTIQALSEGVVLYDTEGRLIDCNPSAERILGLTRAQIEQRSASGQGLWQPIAEDGSLLDDHQLPLARTLATGEPMHGLLVGDRRSEDDVRWLLMNAEPVCDGPERSLRSVVVSFSDVTELRAALDSVRQAKIAEAAARETSDAKNRFLATMTHELQTPLNAIIGFSDLLLMAETDPERSAHLRIISEESRNLQRLIQDVLQVSRIDAGKESCEATVFALGDLMARVMRLYEAEAGQKGLALSLNMSKRVPPLACTDPKLLHQILNNLIANAVKFTDQGRIELALDIDPSLEDDAANLIFHVADTGIGIRPENLSRIFDIFEQEDGSLARRYGGSGLGLAIVRRLVSLLGGKIWVASEVGAGSRFSFSVPVQVPPAATTEAPGRSSRTPVGVTTAG